MDRPNPRHVAIIMDGNGRWATARGLPREAGHREGARRVLEIVRACRQAGVEHLTLYSFSTENWKRPATEVAALMGLLGEFLEQNSREMLDLGVRLHAVGQVERLPRTAREIVRSVCRMSATGRTQLTLNLALSYGGRSEILRAVQVIAREVKAGRLDPEAIDEATISARLDTAGQPDPDLLVRTSGEMRLSNFLLWQGAYTEIYVTETLWPDFGAPQFEEALASYRSRERRFGQVSSSAAGRK